MFLEHESSFFHRHVYECLYRYFSKNKTIITLSLNSGGYYDNKRLFDGTCN